MTLKELEKRLDETKKFKNDMDALKIHNLSKISDVLKVHQLKELKNMVEQYLTILEVIYSAAVLAKDEDHQKIIDDSSQAIYEVESVLKETFSDFVI